MSKLSITYIKEKWAHEGFQKYFQNTGWMFGSRILCMVISFFTTVFVARHLGPENLGQLNYAVSFIGIVGAFSTLGIDNILYREIIRYPDRKREYLGTAFILKLITNIIAAIITITATIFFTHTYDVSRTLIIILSGTFLFTEFQIINYEFQAQVKSKYPSIIVLLITIILSLLKVAVIITGKGVIYFAFILLLEPILYAVFYWFTYEKKIEGNIFAWKFNGNIAKSLLNDSWPLIFTSGFILVYGRIDQILIKHMINAQAVGIYSAAVTIAEAWYFIPNIIIPSFFPAIINAKKTSDTLYYARLKKLTYLLATISVTVALVTTLLAPFIIKLIYGNAFISGTIILQIYVWAATGTFLGNLATSYLIAENKKGLLIFLSFIPMILNLVLNILLIPKYGIVGSAYATLISYTAGPLSLFLFKDIRNNFTKNK